MLIPESSLCIQFLVRPDVTSCGFPRHCEHGSYIFEATTYESIYLRLPSGCLTWPWKPWPIEIDGLPMKICDFPWLC